MMMEDDNYTPIGDRENGMGADKKEPNQIDGNDQVYFNLDYTKSRGIHVLYETADGPAVGNLEQVIAKLQEEGEDELKNNLIEIVAVLEGHASDIINLTPVEDQPYDPLYTFDFSIEPYVWNMTAVHQNLEGKEGKYKLTRPVEALGFIPSKNGVGQHGIEGQAWDFFGKTIVYEFDMEADKEDDVCAAGHGCANIVDDFQEYQDELKTQAEKASGEYEAAIINFDAEWADLDTAITQQTALLNKLKISITDAEAILDGAKSDLDDATTEAAALKAFRMCKEKVSELRQLKGSAKAVNGSIESATARRGKLESAKTDAVEAYTQYGMDSTIALKEIKTFLEVMGAKDSDSDDVDEKKVV